MQRVWRAFVARAEYASSRCLWQAVVAFDEEHQGKLSKGDSPSAWAGDQACRCFTLVAHARRHLRNDRPAVLELEAIRALVKEDLLHASVDLDRGRGFVRSLARAVVPARRRARTSSRNPRSAAAAARSTSRRAPRQLIDRSCMARSSPARSIRPNAAVKVSSDNPEAATAKAAYVVVATDCSRIICAVRDVLLRVHVRLPERPRAANRQPEEKLRLANVVHHSNLV